MSNKVELLGYYGSDEIIACSAWTSTSRELTQEKRDRIPKLIDMLWMNGHECYDDKTEVLTKRGWIYFKDLKKKDYICAVNPDTLKYNFEIPSRIVSYDYDDKMYRGESLGLDFSVTKNHRIFCSQKRKSDGSDYGKEWEIQTSEEVSGKSRKYLTSITSNNTTVLNENFAKLLGFFIGDGYASSKTRISFHIKKKRKIEYLKSITGDDLEEQKGNSFVINNTDFNFINCYNIDNEKIIPFDIYSLSDEDFDNILDGLLKSDGSYKNRGNFEYTFTNQSDSLIEQLFILCPLHGYRITEIRKTKSGYGDTWSRCFTINKKTVAEICNQPSRKIGLDYWQHYKGKVYCATVSTGLMLVRRNNRPVVSGNTPFEKGTVHFLVDTEIASHIHLLKHRISSMNAESARYKELKEDKFYIPEDWSSTHKGATWYNKKYSGEEEYTLQKWAGVLEATSERTNDLYHKCLDELTPILGRKRAKESARFFKMYNSQIQADISFNMRSFANFQKLRNSEHAQTEIRQVAEEMLKLVENIEGNPFKHTLEVQQKRIYEKQY